MNSPTIEIAYGCNFSCGHCMVGKQNDHQFLDIDLFRSIILSLQRLGFCHIGMAASGEMLLHPDLEAMFEFLARRSMKTEVLTNGWLFKERLLPLLQRPRYRSVVTKIGFSLDGPNAAIHDENRGEGSFGRIVEAVGACLGLGIPAYFKSTIRRANFHAISDMILFSSSLQISQHRFITPMPVPRAMRENQFPSPADIQSMKTYLELMTRLTAGKVFLEGWVGDQSSPLYLCNPFSCFSIDAEGYLLLCGVLAYIGDEDGKPLAGLERVADLQHTALEKAIQLHWRRLAEVMEWRLKARELILAGDFSICYWCYYQMGKLNWLKRYPESPWAAGVLRAEKMGIAPMC
jgi:MoaA/NifB/PqqE/SkfB family radical SAM enzyme